MIKKVKNKPLIILSRVPVYIGAQFCLSNKNSTKVPQPSYNGFVLKFKSYRGAWIHSIIMAGP